MLTVIVGMAAQLFPSAFSSYEKLMDTLDITASVFAVPYVMLVGPVAEELIFRGVILDRLKPAFSFWTANGGRVKCNMHDHGCKDCSRNLHYHSQ